MRMSLVMAAALAVAALDDATIVAIFGAMLARDHKMVRQQGRDLAAKGSPQRHRRTIKAPRTTPPSWPA
jgi:hypothetical protein